MKTPAAIASLTVVGSIAFAAGQGTTANPPKPRTSDIQQPDSQPRLVMAGCQTDPSAWFDPIPKRLRPCIGNQLQANTIGRLPIFAADVNADGNIEYFDILNNEEVTVLSGETPVITKPLLYQSVTESAALGTTVYRNSVIDVGAATGQSIEAALGYTNITNIYLFPNGWRDIDHDGDLDLITQVRFRVGMTSYFDSADFWFENIGYEVSQPPLAADLNNDGIVDGADLGILLSVWGEPN
jgi:hypothetical protein